MDVGEFAGGTRLVTAGHGGAGMFNLERAVQRWREELGRRSSLSPREVDELEDHLRARLDLELELDAGMDPARTFAIVRHELGLGTALAGEFEKARKPIWRRWLVTGWAMFAASFVLTGAATLPSRMLFGPLANLGHAVAVLITYVGPLTNLLMLATLLELGAARPGRTRWLAGLVSLATVLNLAWTVLWTGTGFGYSAWVASFFCVATALWMRAREMKPATLEPTGAQ